MKNLLIVAHTPSVNTKTLADAILDGAQDAEVDGVNSVLRSPFECNAESVLQHDGLVLFTTENFGSMSGALKDFFERIYYPCLEAGNLNNAKPYSLVVRAGLDGAGTQVSVKKIINGLKWQSVMPDLICKGTYQAEFEDQCRILGMTMAAGIGSEIF